MKNAKLFITWSTLDEPYSRLLNLVHEFIDKFVKMTYDIGHSMSKSNVTKLKNLIDSYNFVESYDILSKLQIDNKVSQRLNQSSADGNSNFKIIFEDRK